MPVPDFSPGEVLTASAMDSIGMWLVKTQTFSSQTNCDVTSCFSGDFENYIAVVRVAASVAGQYTNVRLLNGTTPKSTNYSRAGFVTLSTNGTSADSGGTSQDGWRLGGQSTVGMYTTLKFYRPFTSAPTGYATESTYTGPSNYQLYWSAGEQTENYIADGFRVYADGNAATYTGTIRVYGLRN
jgi:hypothetical protein